MEENAKIQNGADKILSILSLNNCMFYSIFSTYKLQVNASWYVKNCFFASQINYLSLFVVVLHPSNI